VADLAYGTCLRLAWRDTPMLWGVITVPSLSAQNFNVTCSAVDRTLSLQGHYLNLGDDALASNTVKSTLNGAITSGALSLVVASTSGFPPPPFRLSVGSEMMRVTLSRARR
jgi:hypothetical protein